MLNEAENKCLKKIACIQEDACEFYDDAMEKFENPSLVSTCQNLKNLHEDVKRTIMSKLRENGNNDEIDSTIMGEMKQFFGELKAKISNDSDETLVAELEEAEDRSLHSMQDAMKNDDITSSTKSFLQKELTTLQKSHDYMKALKENMKAA